MEPEDYFNTKEFKSLNWWNRFKTRIKIAFFMTISNL